MSDCEKTDFFWESWTWPATRERKSDSKKDNKYQKRKNKATMKTDENVQKKKKKKKKNAKFKEAMEGRSEKKKDMKKKKNRLALELGDSFLSTQTATSRSDYEPKLNHLTQDSKKNSRRKKKVVFDLSPGYIRTKHPTFVSSSQQCPKQSTLLENEAVRDSESCSQVTATGHSLDPTPDNDSQCNSEDINSQDLFITQKTFRASPPEVSSGEANDVTTTPQMFTQRDKLHTSVAQIKQHLEGSHKHVQHHRKTKENVKKPKTVRLLLTEDEEELNKAHQITKKRKQTFQTPMEPKANLTKQKDAPGPVHIKPSLANPYLDEPVDVEPSLDVAKSKKQSRTSTSTQTENFFTSELSSYLNFCQKSTVASHFEDLKPLDLSVQQRARKDLNRHPPCSSDIKDVKVKKEPSGRHPCCASSRGKGETAVSPQSESEPKSADTTTSSEDGKPSCRAGKLDLTQVRAVQMRLNESFFFKTKGEGQSPRPVSPLMKLAQSREVKSRKGH